MSRMICKRHGCTKRATKQLAIRILVSEHLDPQRKKPAFGNYDIYSCDEHATAENAKIMYEALAPSRPALEDRCTKEGKMMPDWDRSYCHWVNMVVEKY